MVHNLVKWKTVMCESQNGDFVPLQLPEIIDIRNDRKLLENILSMPRKKPITFYCAIRMVSEKRSTAFALGQLGDDLGQYGWYDLNFVEWISDLGFHIELTGDEFEGPFVSM